MEQIPEVKIKKDNIPVCRRCNRKLKDTESVERGFGKICYRKYMAENTMKPLFEVKKNESKAKESTGKTKSNT